MFLSIIRTRQNYILFLQTGISICALVYALWGIDVESLIRGITTWSFAPMLLAFAVMITDHGIMGIRIYSVMSARVNLKTSMQGMIMCLGYNNILPAKAGDVLKTLYLSKCSKLPLAEIAPLMIWERILDCSVLLFLLIFSVLLTTNGSFFPPFLLIIIALFTFMTMRRYRNAFYSLYRKLPFPRIADFLCTAHSQGFEKITLPWFARNVLLTLLLWALYFLCFYVVMVWVAQFELTPSQVLMVFVVTCTGSAIPSTPGSIGFFEAGMVLALSWVGIERDQSLPAALFLHALYFIPVSLLAVCHFSTFRSAKT